MSNREQRKLSQRIVGDRKMWEKSEGRRATDRSIGDVRQGHLNVTYDTVIYPGRINTPEIESGAVTGGEINGSIKNPGQGTYGLRTIGGNGSSNSCAASNHNHSYGFKANFSQAERKEFMADLHELEREPKPNALTRQIIRLSRMQCDEPDMSAEELIERLDKWGDASATAEEHDWAHEWRLEHEQDYYARWMVTYDRRYREEMGDHPRIQGSLERLRQEDVQMSLSATKRALRRHWERLPTEHALKGMH